MKTEITQQRYQGPSGGRQPHVFFGRAGKEYYWPALERYNEEKSNSYEIETSYDGPRFLPGGQVAGQHVAEGAAAEHNYQYVPDKNVAGKLC